ncbi:MAG: transporter [Gemmatimonadota bacterium]
MPKIIFVLLALLVGAAGLPGILGAQIVTDRPDFVEASVTVGAGIVQVETSAAYARSGSGSGRSAHWTTPSLLRVGIGETLELRLETDFLTRDVSADATRGPSGFSDVAVGFKWHALDAVDATPSLAFLVHAGLPVGSAGLRGEGVHPTLRASAEWEFAGGYGLGMMPGLGWNPDEEGYTYGIFALVVGKSLSRRLRVFAEIALQEMPLRDAGAAVGTWDTGLSLLLRDDVQWDAALSLPATDAADDFFFTTGISLRLNPSHP